MWNIVGLSNQWYESANFFHSLMIPFGMVPIRLGRLPRWFILVCQEEPMIDFDSGRRLWFRFIFGRNGNGYQLGTMIVCDAIVARV